MLQTIWHHFSVEFSLLFQMVCSILLAVLASNTLMLIDVRLSTASLQISLKAIWPASFLKSRKQADHCTTLKKPGKNFFLDYWTCYNLYASFWTCDPLSQYSIQTADLACMDITVTESRLDNMDFTVPIMNTGNSTGLAMSFISRCHQFLYWKFQK